MSQTFVPTSWLFVRNDESIRIFRPRVDALLISGPGHALIRPEFIDDAALEAFQAEIAETLEDAGWLALGEGYERRRNRSDRRRTARGPDRRNQDA